MNELKQSLAQWGHELSTIHLPRWHELPQIELYMDQVITVVEQYLSPVIDREKHLLLTSSMVNNYVKLDLIPAPQKKKYNQQHLAFLIAITLLKQVLTIPEIKKGILFQSSVVGIREAYNLFCEEQEAALAVIAAQLLGKTPVPTFQEVIPTEMMAIKAATLSFALKMLSEKMIELGEVYLTESGEKNE